MQEVLSLVTGAGGMDIVSLAKQASPAVKAVMALLVLMSVVVWYIIVVKTAVIKRAARESGLFTDSFWRSRDIEQIYKSAQKLRSSSLSVMFVAGYTELAKLSSDEDQARDREADLENVRRALHKAQTSETTKLEQMIPFLATTGSSAPFIGLFGTVLGIMNTFTEIGAQKSASIQTVAPSIGEALLATAVGLLAAIPAVMAFNYFQRRIRVLVSDMQTFEQDYLNIIRRHFLK